MKPSLAQKTGVTLALMGVLVAFACGSAAAQEATVNPCQGNPFPDSNAGWTGPSAQTTVWKQTGGCEIELKVDPVATDKSWTADFEYKTPGSSARFTSVSFDISGGDGSDGGLTQEMLVCDAEQRCSNPFTADGPADSTPRHVDMDAGDDDFPASADRIVLRGRCVLYPACEPARPLVVANLAIIAEDDSAPELKWLGTGDSRALALSTDPIKRWNSGKRTFPLTADDDGTGVRQIDYFLGNLWLTDWSTSCSSQYVDSEPQGSNPVYAFCPRQWTGSTAHDLTRWSSLIGTQGPVTASITAQDAAGNVSEPLAIPFNMDTRAPTFSGLEVTSDTPDGWQTGASVDLKWVSGRDAVEDSWNSGVKKALLSIEPFVGQGSSSSSEVPLERPDSLTGISVPGPGTWLIIVRLLDAAGNISDPHEVVARVDGVIPDPPTIASPGPLGSTALETGASLEWLPPTNLALVPSSICRYALKIDQAPHADPGDVGGIPGAARSWPLPSGLRDGISYAHLRAISCAGVAGGIADVALVVDTEGPEASFSPATETGWHSDRQPLFVRTSGAGSDVTVDVSVDGLHVLADTPGAAIPLTDGTHYVEAVAKDSLGNTTAIGEQVHFDATAPTGSISFVPGDPTRINAHVSDGGSGLQDAQVQISPERGGKWQPITAVVRPTGGEPSMEIAAAVPDTTLVDGRYLVRVFATDRAGHELSAESISEPSVAQIELPLRGLPVLRARWRSAKGKASPSTMTIDGRSHPQLSGTLMGPFGEPLAGAPVDFYQTILGSPRELVGQIATDGNGSFTIKPRYGPSRLITLRFPGSQTMRPQQVAVTLLSRSTLTLRASRRHVRGGRRIAFNGSLKAPGLSQGIQGRPVALQAFAGGRWRRLPLDALVNRAGHFRITWVTEKVRRSVVWRIRAKVGAAPGWPYETGYSRPVRVEVLG